MVSRFGLDGLSGNNSYKNKVTEFTSKDPLNMTQCHEVSTTITSTDCSTLKAFKFDKH